MTWYWPLVNIDISSTIRFELVSSFLSSPKQPERGAQINNKTRRNVDALRFIIVNAASFVGINVTDERGLPLLFHCKYRKKKIFPKEATQ
jgi:hypothetical protein